MDPLTVGIVLAALVAGTVLVGALGRLRAGRIRGGRGLAGIDLAPGAEVTLLQFSSELCSPCRATARVLDGFVSERVAHVEVDVAAHPELAARHRVMQTPTTLLVDRTGAVRARIGGTVRRDLLGAELERMLTP